MINAHHRTYVEKSRFPTQTLDYTSFTTRALIAAFTLGSLRAFVPATTACIQSGRINGRRAIPQRGGLFFISSAGDVQPDFILGFCAEESIGHRIKKSTRDESGKAA